MLPKSVVFALLALQASSAPYPQGVTESIAPDAPPKEGCQMSYEGTFGVTIMNSTTSSSTTQMSDGQPNASGEASQTDGQVQNQAAPANQISDGQVQNQAAPVNQIADGQVQNQAAPVNQIADGQVQNQAAPANQIADGQVQNQAAPANQIADGQAQQPASSGGSSGSSGSSGALTGCQKDDSLQLTLKDGVLMDSKGRTGYIAGNKQYQFDSPPQAGAIVTSGFSICNGAIALGDKDTFYQCLSGTFYNIYDSIPDGRTDCEEVKMMVLNLKQC